MAKCRLRQWSGGLPRVLRASEASLPRTIICDCCRQTPSRTGLPDLAMQEGQAEIDAAVGEAELIVVYNISTLFRSGNGTRVGACSSTHRPQRAVHSSLRSRLSAARS